MSSECSELFELHTQRSRRRRVRWEYKIYSHLIYLIIERERERALLDLTPDVYCCCFGCPFGSCWAVRDSISVQLYVLLINSWGCVGRRFLIDRDVENQYFNTHFGKIMNPVSRINNLIGSCLYLSSCGLRRKDLLIKL